jgi:hypothetical protein
MAGARAGCDAGAMIACELCGETAAEPLLTDPRSGAAMHAACAVGRLPQDAAVAMLGAVALALLPPVIVWAG